MDKIEVNLVQSKQTIGKHSAAHAEVVQDYASKCYPETTSILFLLGLVAVEKLQKVQDALKEKGVKEEAKMFTGVLKDTMEQMETLKEEALKLGHEFYLGVSHDWKEMTLIVSEGLK